MRQIPPLMTTREVAALFGVEIKTILRWARQGKLVHVRTPGNRVRIITSQPAILEALGFPEGDSFARH